MDSPRTYISLLVIGATIALTASLRRLARQSLHRRDPGLYSDVLELTGAFQVCACTHELGLLFHLPPTPQAELALVYLATVLHSFSLASSRNNPIASFQLLCRKKSTLRTWFGETSAQFLGATFAHIYSRALWSLLGTTPVLEKALGEHCNHPIHTTTANAFLIECLFSIILQMTLLTFESADDTVRAHLLALLVTGFVYTGGPLTGAVVNPALAFSLFFSCFLEKFWNYTLVYWVAPCIGSVWVAVVWEDLIPYLRRHLSV